MIHVMQTTFGDPHGNCLAACIASILEIEDIDAVPSFVGSGQKWFDDMTSWFMKEHRLYLLYTDAEFEGVLNIAIGRSPRGNWTHAVVAEGSAMVHDPHPDNIGVLGEIDRIYFLPRDPMRRIR